MEPTSWSDRPAEDALATIKAGPASYVGAARNHALVMEEGRGALFAMPTPEGAVQTFYLPQKEARAFFRDKGGGWLRWYKRKARPEIRFYDPKTEAVVLTRHEDGPRVTVISLQTSES